MKVWLLWEYATIEFEEKTTLIGIYTSELKAKRAKNHAEFETVSIDFADYTYEIEEAYAY